MPDYFDTTARLARERSQGIERGFGTLQQGLGQVASLGMQAAQGQQTQNLLKSMGIISDKTEPLTSKDYEDIAKKSGVTDFAVNPKMTEEEKLSTAQKMFDVLGLPHPQPKSGIKFDYDKAAKAGLTYKPDMFGGAAEFKPPSPLEEAYKKSQLDYYTNINKQMSGASGTPTTNLVYRHPITGEEVDPQTAINDINSGRGQYIITQKNVTRAGVKETPLIKPQDLSMEEKNYLNTAKRIGSALDGILEKFPTIFANKDPKLAEQLFVEKLPFWAVKDPDIQTLKSDLNYLKADIPFLRGGKQLTPMEAKRVDTLLSPIGKSEATYRRDIERFKTEFGVGEALVKYGIAAPMMSKALSKTTDTDSPKQIQSQEEFNALPKGSLFIGPDGQKRRKP